MASTIHSFVGSYHEQIEGAISKAMGSFGPKSELRDAIEYALKNGGKRFRPAIVYMVAKALGKDLDVTEAALAIEFFHTASLIADDLPSMDNDERRRNSPTVHIAYDEATAELSYLMDVCICTLCIFVFVTFRKVFVSDIVLAPWH